jgi:hypothetical protein
LVEYFYDWTDAEVLDRKVLLFFYFHVILC